MVKNLFNNGLFRKAQVQQDNQNNLNEPQEGDYKPQQGFRQKNIVKRLFKKTGIPPSEEVLQNTYPLVEEVDEKTLEIIINAIGSFEQEKPELEEESKEKLKFQELEIATQESISKENHGIVLRLKELDVPVDKIYSLVNPEAASWFSGYLLVTSPDKIKEMNGDWKNYIRGAIISNNIAENNEFTAKNFHDTISKIRNKLEEQKEGLADGVFNVCSYSEASTSCIAKLFENSPDITAKGKDNGLAEFKNWDEMGRVVSKISPKVAYKLISNYSEFDYNELSEVTNLLVKNINSKKFDKETAANILNHADKADPYYLIGSNGKQGLISKLANFKDNDIVHNLTKTRFIGEAKDIEMHLFDFNEPLSDWVVEFISEIHKNYPKALNRDLSDEQKSIFKDSEERKDLIENTFHIAHKIGKYNQQDLLYDICKTVDTAINNKNREFAVNYWYNCCSNIDAIIKESKGKIFVKKTEEESEEEQTYEGWALVREVFNLASEEYKEAYKQINDKNISKFDKPFDKLKEIYATDYFKEILYSAFEGETKPQKAKSPLFEHESKLEAEVNTVEVPKKSKMPVKASDLDEVYDPAEDFNNSLEELEYEGKIPTVKNKKFAIWYDKLDEHGQEYKFNKVVTCGICLGGIKPTEPAYKCKISECKICQSPKYFHPTCTTGVPECPYEKQKDSEAGKSEGKNGPKIIRKQ